MKRLKKLQPDCDTNIFFAKTSSSVSSTIATDQETTSTGFSTKRKRPENEGDEADWSGKSVHNNVADIYGFDLNFFLEEFPYEHTSSDIADEMLSYQSMFDESRR